MSSDQNKITHPSRQSVFRKFFKNTEDKRIVICTIDNCNTPLSVCINQIVDMIELYFSHTEFFL